MDGRSSLNMNENIVALLAYLFGWISGLILFVIERRSNFVRFHALQSLVFFGGMSLILGVLGRIPIFGWAIAIGGGILSIGFWIIGMVRAYRGELYRFPVVGDFVARQIGE